MAIRSPICTVLGHVDHGKSKILDTIRGSNIVAKEAGGITQAIGASIIPLGTIKKKCGVMLEKMQIQFTIPGLLFIDTPGHAAFTSLRKRGGNIADIAVLVVDINEGIMPQTAEAIEILKTSKTPFVVAANKVDLIPGWKSTGKENIVEAFNQQNQETMERLDIKLYELVGKFSEMGFESERLDRVQDFTKQLVMVPVSAMTGEGIASLLMIVAGLAQRFLQGNLEITEGGAKGTILEVKEEKGLGKVMDIIIYDGSMKREDILVIGGIEAPIVTKIKMLLEPEHLCEMRDKKTKYTMCKEVVAAIGVRVVAQNIDAAIAGMPIRTCTLTELEEKKEEVQKEVSSAMMSTDTHGVVIKADTIGSLEAMRLLLKERNIPVMRASIGTITKKDLADAESNVSINPEHAIILGFNVTDQSGVCIPKIKIITHQIIYQILDDLDYYLKHFKEEQEKREFEGLTYPAKFEILEGYVFRQSNPAICGVHLMRGKMKAGMKVMKNGQTITEIKSIAREQETISEAKKDDQIAVSMPCVIIGRQIKEHDILYSALTEDEYRKLKTLKKFLREEDIETLKEIAGFYRVDNVVWGV